jgi:hypothetical protein
MATKNISFTDLEELSSDELAERFKETDLELCVEPLSEWGSQLEELFQKLEKGVMQWYEEGSKRSLVICFLDVVKETAKPTEQESTEGQDNQNKETRASETLETPAILPN